MTDEPKGPTLVTTLPSAVDEMAAAFAASSRVWRQQRLYAEEIARTRKALFDAYVKAGFTEAQALDLCKSLSIT